MVFAARDWGVARGGSEAEAPPRSANPKNKRPDANWNQRWFLPQRPHLAGSAQTSRRLRATAMRAATIDYRFPSTDAVRAVMAVIHKQEGMEVLTYSICQFLLLCI